MLETRVPSQLEVLGGAHLLSPGAERWRLERKTAGLLAYLALEGATPRSKLAGLLWPQSPEATARNNLRQVLRRVREGSGIDPFEGDDPLSLAPRVSVDAAKLEIDFFAGRFHEVIAFDGELLDGLDYEDCTEFTEWLLAQREHLTALRRDALTQLAEQAEREGDHRFALLYAERLLEIDPISEVAHRAVMRLHYVLGDRGAALSAFERCRAVLSRELGVEPLPETAALARSIEDGERLREPIKLVRREIPLSVQRPPVLVGREREWAALEAAWEARIGVAICGEPGVGKTRVILEFIASKGEFVLIEGRPGDEQLPYSTLARSLRNTRERLAKLRLEPWARRELARLIPSLEPDAPPPISSDADKLRFFEAMVSVIEALIKGGVVALVLEDLQFVDAASLEAWRYFTTRFGTSSEPPLRHISTFRTGELQPEFETLLRQGLNAGQMTLIEVKRLEPESLNALVDGLGLRVPDGLASALSRHTGGNPLFVLETLRSLIESGDLERGLPARLPVPDRLGSLVARRLERLSLSAQRLARTVAVAGADFDLEMGARVLETHPLNLSEPWVELEAAQFVHATNFAHELLAEATLATVPSPIRTLLHRRIAIDLETNRAEAARVAHHWLEGCEPARAVPFLRETAQRAHASFELRGEADTLELMGRILESLGRPREAFAAFEQGFAALCRVNTGERCEAFTEHLMRLAKNPEDIARAWTSRAELLHLRGEGTQGEEVALQALERARRTGDERLVLRARNALIHAIYVQSGRADDLITLLRESQAIAERLEDKEALANLEGDLGVLLSRKDEFFEATRHDRRAMELLEDLHREGRLSDPQLRPHIRLNLAGGLANVGRHEEALSFIREAESLHREIGEDTDVAIHLLVNAISMLHQLERYTEALGSIGKLEQLLETYRSWLQPYFFQRQLEIYPDLGQFERTQQAIDALLGLPNLPAGRRIYALIAQSRIYPASRALEPILEAETVLQTISRPLAAFRLFLVKSALVAPDEGLRLAEACLEAFSSRGSDGGVVTARLRCAQAQLALGQPELALEPSALALEALTEITPELASRSEVALVRYRTLLAVGDPGARIVLERALERLFKTADRHVPPEFRESFLNRNPTNRAILEAASDLGLGPH